MMLNRNNIEKNILFVIVLNGLEDRPDNSANTSFTDQKPTAELFTGYRLSDWTQHLSVKLSDLATPTDHTVLIHELQVCLNSIKITCSSNKIPQSAGVVMEKRSLSSHIKLWIQTVPLQFQQTSPECFLQCFLGFQSFCVFQICDPQ